MLDAKRETGIGGAPYLRNRDVHWGNVNCRDLPRMDFNEADRLRYSLREGDVLVCEGGEIGRSAVWTGQLDECYFQKALHRVRPRTELSPYFLRYFLQAVVNTSQIRGLVTGSTIGHLPQEKLRLMRLPLPPRPEQDRIVAAIEEEFSRIDLGSAGLKRCRDLNQVLQEEGLRRAFASLHKYPRAALEEVADTSSGGTPARSVKANFGGSIPWVKSGELRENHITRTQEHLSEKGVASSSAKFVRRGAVLVALYGATVGRVAILDLDQATTNQAVCAITPRERLDRDYLYYFLRASRRYLIAAAKGGAQPNISQEILRRMEVSLPPPAEQRKVARELTEFLDSVLSARTTFSVSLNRVERLREAVLRAAFSGRLAQ